MGLRAISHPWVQLDWLQNMIAHFDALLNMSLQVRMQHGS